MKTLSLLAIMAFLLAGCANYNEPARTVYFPACYQPLQQANQLDSRAREIGVGAGKGFLAGTLAGLAAGGVSALFTGNPMNLVSGAAIGAAGGAVAGGVYGGMQDNQAQKDALMAQWYSESGGLTKNMPFNQAAATMSMQCYNQQTSKIEKDLQLGLITDQGAMPMLNEIQMGRQEAANLFEQGQ